MEEKMKMVEIGQSIHCNRCDGVFAASAKLVRAPFGGQRAARIETYCVCPHCGMNDSHWIYASSDMMPDFEGGFDARKRAERNWLQQN